MQQLGAVATTTTTKQTKYNLNSQSMGQRGALATFKLTLIPTTATTMATKQLPQWQQQELAEKIVYILCNLYGKLDSLSAPPPFTIPLPRAVEKFTIFLRIFQL